MPSPVGHVVAGVTIAWAVEALTPLRPRSLAVPSARTRSRFLTPLVAACAVLALAPDMDILLAAHRAYTHSLGAVAIVALAAAAVAYGRGVAPLAPTLACTLAWASHVFLDWLGRDATPPIGLMALWPFTRAYLYSGIDLFAEVSRRYWDPREFILGNAWSISREVAILLPFAALAWLARRRGQYS